MRRQSNHFRYLSAAGVLAFGAACAANVYLKPPSYRGPDTAQLRQLADRVSAAPPLQEAPLYVPPARHYQAPEVMTQVRTRQVAAPVITPTRKPVQEPTPQPSKPTPEAAVKQIALTGVTQQGDAPTAWLVDIETHERETVALGESAFGFVVKEIGAESVLLAQDGEEFTVHMGDKEIPVEEPDPSLTLAQPVAVNPNDGVGRWGRRNLGGFSGGGNRSSRWSGGGGGWNGGGNRSGGGGNRGGSRGGTAFNNFSRPQFGGNFGGFGGQNFNQRNNRNSTLNRPTSNPQEARRRGGRLMGGANPIPAPASITNPQTSRRRGTNSGRAFGSDPNWR